MKKFFLYLSAIVGLAILINTLLFYYYQILNNCAIAIIPDFRYLKTSVVISLVGLCVFYLIIKKRSKGNDTRQ